MDACPIISPDRTDFTDYAVLMIFVYKHNVNMSFIWGSGSIK